MKFYSFCQAQCWSDVGWNRCQWGVQDAPAQSWILVPSSTPPPWRLVIPMLRAGTCCICIYWARQMPSVLLSLIADELSRWEPHLQTVLQQKWHFLNCLFSKSAPADLNAFSAVLYSWEGFLDARSPIAVTCITNKLALVSKDGLVANIQGCDNRSFLVCLHELVKVILLLHLLVFPAIKWD